MKQKLNQQYFGGDKAQSEAMIEKKKAIREHINKLNDQCYNAQDQTKQALNKLKSQLEEEVFNAERQNFVTTTLQEFDNLEPQSLDVLFEYKSEDLKIQKEDIRISINKQREYNDMPVLKMTDMHRRA